MNLITPSGVPCPIGMYSALFEVDLTPDRRLVTFSGLVGVCGDGTPGPDVGSQVRLIFEGLDRIVQYYGAERSDVGKLLTFLRDDVPFEDYSAARTPIYEDWYPDGVYPAHSLAMVSGLAGPDLLVEIEGMLVVPRHGR